MSDTTVKSVARVFEVLEAFERERKPLRTREIAERYGYPISSTSALLKSMATLGYLSYDRLDRAFLPTLRVAMLGEWIPAVALDIAKLDALLKDVRDATGATTAASIQNDLEMQFVRILQGIRPIVLNLSVGQTASLWRSAIGRTLLSTKPNKEIRRIVERINSRIEDEQDQCDAKELIENVEQIRRNGFAVAYDQVLPDTGAIAMALPRASGQSQVIVATGGPSHQIKEAESEIVQIMRNAIGRHFLR